MKTIGLIGGTGWASTAEYYKRINESVNFRIGGINFAQCIIYSFNLNDIHQLAEANEYDRIFDLLLDAAKKLQSAGADFLVLCTNTMHRFANRLTSEISIPLVHIAEATADEIIAHKLKCVGLLGTAPTMKEEFYRSILTQSGLKVLVPEDSDIDFIHNAIFNELVKGKFNIETKSTFINIMNKLHERGAEGIVLGCTEIPLIIKPEDFFLPLFNTLEIHVKKIVQYALI
ncbi:MAG: amino acid racemase [Bacteroidia bacterium]|nr:amino acid racemase [Bacteroidia bacterium]